MIIYNQRKSGDTRRSNSSTHSSCSVPQKLLILIAEGKHISYTLPSSSFPLQMAKSSPQSHSLGPDELADLAAHAITAKSHAYCPYSNFRVGCAILTTSPSASALSLGSTRTTFTGANVEIAATPVGTCAERCALASLVASFQRPYMPTIRAVAVASDVEPPASPCGMCRQFIREFADESVSLYFSETNTFILLYLFFSPPRKSPFEKSNFSYSHAC